jgi:hypothetical protein
MNAIPDSAGTTNLAEFRFIAVSVSSDDYLLDARRAAPTPQRNPLSSFALRRLTFGFTIYPVCRIERLATAVRV